MQAIKAVKVTITGEQAAIAIASNLIMSSVWFRVEPLPSAQYEICVKAENGALLPVRHRNQPVPRQHILLTETWQ